MTRDEFVADRLAAERMKAAGREFEDWEAKAVRDHALKPAQEFLVMLDAAKEFETLRLKGRTQ